MLFVLLTALTALASAPPGHTADVARMNVAGISLGMSIADAETATLKLDLDPSILENHKRTYYTCADWKKTVVIPKDRTGGPRDIPLSDVPAGTCIDSEVIGLKRGMLRLVFLPRIPGDASSQVVASLELIDEVDLRHAQNNESMPVRYYESKAVEKYGQPTYVEPFKTDKPPHYATQSQEGADAYALCKLAFHCSEHDGEMIWCSGTADADTCRRNVLPEDDGITRYRRIGIPTIVEQYHSESPIGSPVELSDRHRFEQRAREEPAEIAKLNELSQYRLREGPYAPQRLVLSFLPATSSADVKLQDLELFEKIFPLRYSGQPAPLETPQF